MCYVSVMFVVFFFKQKTAYEMRISDWSSDVCSSDLKVGRTAVWERLPGLISDLKLDFVIVNGENAAGGFGITEDIFLETINAGADVVTTGNHVWDQKEAVVYADRPEQFLRPANR